MKEMLGGGRKEARFLEVKEGVGRKERELDNFFKMFVSEIKHWDQWEMEKKISGRIEIELYFLLFVI